MSCRIVRILPLRGARVPGLVLSRAALSLLMLPIAVATASLGQTTPAAPTSQPESIQDLVSRLTAEQRQQFVNAMNAFKAQNYTESLTGFKALLTTIPGDPLLSKFVANAALDTGDSALALKTVKPVAQSDPNDWQAAGLLTRACAETDDSSCRDAQMAHMLELHVRGITPEGMQQYTVEQLKLGPNTLTIIASLEPVGYYKVYDMGRLADAKGNVFVRITIESADPDQIMFAKEHPKEAAKGMRSFSLDAYRETGLNSSGQRTQTHYFYKFFVGQPSYETVREEFINVANEKTKALTSRTGLIVP